MRSRRKIFISAAVCIVCAAALILIASCISLDNGFADKVKTALDPAYAASKEMSAMIADEPSDEPYISPSDISINGDYGFVADETGHKVYKLDMLKEEKMQTEAEFPEQVNAVLAQGDYVYVLYGQLNGKVQKFDTNLNPQGEAVGVGHTPKAAVMKGAQLYVANRFSATVSVIDTADMTLDETIKVAREPFDLALADDKLYVAHHLQNEAADKKIVACSVSVIDTAQNYKVTSIKLKNGSESLKGICASPDGKYVYVTHLLARYGYPTSQLDRGWINTNAMSIIDAETDTYVTSVLLDDVDLGAGNPWGIDMTHDGEKIVVASSGTQEAIIIDVSGMHDRILKTKNGEYSRTYSSMKDIPNYLNFMEGLKQRIALPDEAKNPREMDISQNKAYFANYISGDVSVVDLSDYKTDTISLGTQPETDKVRRGEALWNDATYCYQKWESCASCHPDARMDSINWDNLNDGMGNPKSAKSMLYSHRTPPAMATGIRETAERGVRAGMQFIQFNTLSEEDMRNIDEYLMSLKPEQSPHLNSDSTLSESVDIGAGLTGNAVSGKQLFSANCASCHSGPFFTDNKMHPTNLYEDYGWEKEQGKEYNTPSLVEVWRTGPYGINGSFATVYDYVKATVESQNINDLSDNDIRDISAYVLSIGDENEVYSVEQVRVYDPKATNFSASSDYNCANVLTPGSTITEISFRRQWKTDKDAVAEFKLYDDQGEVIKSESIKLSKDMNMRKAAVLDMNDYIVPENAEEYVISIAEDGNPGNKLASDLVVKAD